MNNHFNRMGIAVLLAVGLVLALTTGVMGSTGCGGPYAGHHRALCRSEWLQRQKPVLRDHPG